MTSPETSNRSPEEAASLTFEGAPLFIGGDGRSGTTLLSVILNSHPELAVGPELHFAGRIENLGPKVLHCIHLLEAGDHRTWGRNLSKHPEIKLGVQFVHRAVRAGIPRNVLQRFITEQMRATESDLGTFNQRCALVNSMGWYNAEKTSKPRWGFKIMKEIRNVSSYAEAWPNAQFLHIIRDGRDVAASQMKDHASWGYADIERASQGWARIIRYCRRNAPAGRLYELRYEDLVHRQRKTMEDVLAFLGVKWNDTVLHHDRHRHDMLETMVRHPSAKAVAQPVNATAIGRYRNDLTTEQIRIFEKLAGDLLTELGYAQA